MTDLLRRPGSALFCGEAWGSTASRGQCGREETPAHAISLSDPLRVISGRDPDALPAALDAVERELAAGHVVAGFMCYEAGRVFGLQTHDPWNPTPLYWFGVYEAAVHPSPVGRGRPAGAGVGPVPDMRLNVTRDEYCAALARVKEYIAAGDTYQVNYTCHARFAADLDPLDYFLAMVRSHPVPYAAYLDLGEAQIVSISPELLLEKRGDILRTKPMKGTRKRGRTPEEDAALRDELTSSLKDRAENLMSVDMMRNDLGRVCEIGSVDVPVLFEAEQYRSVWQMTTTVTGRVREDVGLRRVMEAILPGSSVTGAPKQRTMEIIHELEPEPRGVYCGAVCLFLPNGDWTLNLPIRTLVHRAGRYDLGIGSGIVWDSDPLSEYEETLLKSQFARRLTPELRLFETMLAEPRGAGRPRGAACPRVAKGCACEDTRAHATHAARVAYESEHLHRLAQSAAYWGFPFAADEAREALRAWVSTHEADDATIVRMELDQEGGLSFSSRPLPPPPEPPVRVLISQVGTDSSDRLLYHKTNQRDLYDAERERAMAGGYFEVVFCNEAGNLTEGAISNLFVRRGGQWLTPPLTDGLLPGIWRADFMARHAAVEAHLTPEMLGEAEEVVIGNSVRGEIRVDEVVLGGQTLHGREWSSRQGADGDH
ncbi:aminodeoxychorismate synthase component I [bacterium]|nr:aminodeoxychorismate synthase component I [bacterium]